MVGWSEGKSQTSGSKIPTEQVNKLIVCLTLFLSKGQFACGDQGWSGHAEVSGEPTTGFESNLELVLMIP